MIESTPRYYTALGKSHDEILRCFSCNKLVLVARLNQAGACPHCETKRFTEVRGLTLWEWVKIRIGLLNFPYKKEFLNQFNHNGK